MNHSDEVRTLLRSWK